MSTQPPPGELPNERKAREEAEAKAAKLKEELNEDFQLSLFFDALIDIFAGSQDTVPGELDPNAGAVQTSTFTDVINNNAQLKNVKTAVADNQNKSVAGLYAMIMQKHEVLLEQQEDDAPPNAAPRTNSGWGYALKKMSRGYSAFMKVATARPFENAPPPSLTDIIEETSSGLEILDFPEYYIYIFSDVGDNNATPTVLEERRETQNRFLGPLTYGYLGRGSVIDRKFTNLESYPKGIITSKKLRDEEELTSGTIVRVSFEGAANRKKLIIQEIVENSPSFTELVMRSLGARTALTREQACNTDSTLTNTTHATGDPIGDSSNVSELRINDNIIYPYKQGATVNLVVFINGNAWGGTTGQQYVYKTVKELGKITSTMFLLPDASVSKPSSGIINWSSVQNAISTLESEHGITITSKRLGAWSAGIIGFRQATEATENNYFDAGLFLADPSPSTRVLGSNFTRLPSQSIYMEYNANNWGSYPSLKDQFPAMAAAIQARGGEAKSVAQTHAQILKSILTILNT